MEESKAKQSKAILIVLIIGIILIVTAIVVVGVVLYKQGENVPQNVPQEINQGGALVVEDNIEEIKEQVSQKVSDGMFEVQMNTIWTFPDGEKASTDAYLANSVSNHFSISIEVILNDTQESVYKSGLIPVGNQLSSLKLDKDLDMGTYSAVCYYHLWKEDGTENSVVGVNVTLNVLK